VNEDEFRRRIEVYVETDLPDLADDRERIATALSHQLWPLVNGWQAQMHTFGGLLRWVGERLQADWPDAAARLQFEQTGSETGWLLSPRPSGDESA